MKWNALDPDSGIAIASRLHDRSRAGFCIDLGQLYVTEGRQRAQAKRPIRQHKLLRGGGGGDAEKASCTHCLPSLLAFPSPCTLLT